MEYIIEDLIDTTTDNYLKDIINCKGLSIDDKLKMIKTYMINELELKLELEKILSETKSIMLEVIENGEEFNLLLDNDVSIKVYSLEDLGSLIKKVNKKADYEDLINYITCLLNFPYNELDVKLVECLNSNTTNEQLKKITGLWLEIRRKGHLEVKRVGKHIVVNGVDSLDIDNEKLVEVMKDTYMNTCDFELRVLVAEWLLKNIYGDGEDIWIK